MPTPLQLAASSFITELKEGSPDAFSRLYDQYARILFGVINRIITHDEQKAAAVLVATFDTIRSDIGQYRPESQPLFLWLLTIARKKASSALAESPKRRVVIQQGMSSNQLVLAASDRPVRQLNSLSRITQPDEPTDKQLLDRVLFRNCTPEEAANSLGLPADTARQQLRKALQQLRKRAYKKA